MRAKGAWLLVIVACASCRVQEPGPPSEAAIAQGRSVQGGSAQREPSAQPEPRGSSGGEREAAGRGAVPGDSSPRPGLEPLPPPEPAALQSLVPIATAFSPTALLLEPVHDASPVVLFPDERAAVRRRAGEVLAAQRVEVVSVPELQRIEAAAAEGRLVLEDDQRCRAALTPDEVASRYFPGRPRLRLSAECFDDCRLTVTVDDPPKYEDMRTWQSPKLARPHDPKAWLAAASRLRATDAMGIGGLGLFGVGGNVPPVQFFAPIGVGPWSEGQPADAPFFALEATIASCAHPDPLVGFTWQVRASVDRRGTVTRCAAETDHSLVHVAGSGCLCAAVETIQFPAGPTGRRLRVEALDDGGSGRNARIELVQPGTETWVTRLQEAPALARCLDANPLPGMLATRVILSLAPDGAVEGVRIDGDITTPASMGLASCLVQELRTVPLPCRPPGIDALHVSLTVNGP